MPHRKHRLSQLNPKISLEKLKLALVNEELDLIFEEFLGDLAKV